MNHSRTQNRPQRSRYRAEIAITIALSIGTTLLVWLKPAFAFPTNESERADNPSSWNVPVDHSEFVGSPRDSHVSIGVVRSDDIISVRQIEGVLREAGIDYSKSFMSAYPIGADIFHVAKRDKKNALAVLQRAWETTPFRFGRFTLKESGWQTCIVQRRLDKLLNDALYSADKPCGKVLRDINKLRLGADPPMVLALRIYPRRIPAKDGKFQNGFEIRVLLQERVSSFDVDFAREPGKSVRFRDLTTCHTYQVWNGGKELHRFHDFGWLGAGMTSFFESRFSQ